MGMLQFQSTHLYKVRYMDCRNGGIICHISIHAPIQGAISASQMFKVPIEISIHAPIQGAIMTEFMTMSEKIISIHAPIQGAIYSTTESQIQVIFQSTHLYKVRCARKQLRRHRKYFNPRTYTRCDAIYDIIM